MPDIVLSTLNARYSHCAFGLRYLLANLGPLESRAVIREFVVHQSAVEIVEAILADSPRIVGLGIYIWNVARTTEVVDLLKRLDPSLVVILGGPEVSYEWEGQRIVSLADHLILGEGETVFSHLCERLLSGEDVRETVHGPSLPDVGALRLPYGPEYYTEEDVAHRVVYVEASRGCPFRCEFCLSALDKKVRRFDIGELLASIDGLIARGRQQFKFVDRTFNLDIEVSRRILEFFADRADTHRDRGLFIHFEMIPDRLPDALRDVIRRFEPGVLQFEVGIQTFSPDVSALISRRQSYERLEANLRFLREETGVHLHTDLIVGLPGETEDSFAEGFDRLVGLNPHEIQIGMLKRLRGTPIIRHTAEFGLVFHPAPPYEILQTSTIDFPAMQRLRRMSQVWDRVGNRGHFGDATALLWHGSSPYAALREFTVWLVECIGRTHSVSLNRLTKLFFRYLTEVRGLERDLVGARLASAVARRTKGALPPFLRPWRPEARESVAGAPLPRQARHLQG